MGSNTKGTVAVCMREFATSLGIRQKLEDAGWDVILCATPAKALDNVFEEEPDWVVLDHLDLLEDVRRLDQAVEPFRTCFVSPGLDGLELGLAFGADLSVVAPFEPGMLEAGS